VVGHIQVAWTLESDDPVSRFPGLSTDCLVVLFPDMDFVFLFDAKRSLSVKLIYKEWGGAYPMVHPHIDLQICVPWPIPQNPCGKGDIQTMTIAILADNSPFDLPKA